MKTVIKYHRLCSRFAARQVSSKHKSAGRVTKHRTVSWHYQAEEGIHAEDRGYRQGAVQVGGCPWGPQNEELVQETVSSSSTGGSNVVCYLEYFKYDTILRNSGSDLKFSSRCMIIICKIYYNFI